MSCSYPRIPTTTISLPTMRRNTKLMQFSKYPGVLISHDMSWLTHINKVVTKAHQKLGFICRNLSGSPQECKKLAFLVLVRSGLEYTSIIWDPYLQKDCKSIKRVQWKAARWVTSSYDRRTSVTKLLKNLQWDSLQGSRRQQRLVFMYKILNDQVAVPANSIDLTYSSITLTLPWDRAPPQRGLQAARNPKSG